MKKIRWFIFHWAAKHITWNGLEPKPGIRNDILMKLMDWSGITLEDIDEILNGK